MDLVPICDMCSEVGEKRHTQESTRLKNLLRWRHRGVKIQKDPSNELACLGTELHEVRRGELPSLEP